MFSFSSLFPLNGVPYTVNEFPKRRRAGLSSLIICTLFSRNDSATGGYALTCRRRNLRKKDCFIVVGDCGSVENKPLMFN